MAHSLIKRTAALIDIRLNNLNWTRDTILFNYS